MKHYKVFFEFFGRKMQTTVEAESEAAAKQAVRDRIDFIKVEKLTNEEAEGLDDFIENLEKMLGVKIGKK